jgi:hypothetical protein
LAIEANTSAQIYITGGSGSAPFDESGNLIIQPRVSAANPRDIHFFTGDTTPVSRMVINRSGNVGIMKSPGYPLDIDGDLNLDTGHVFRINAVQVVGARVIDARIDDAINSGDATTDGVIDAMRDAMIAHGLMAPA